MKLVLDRSLSWGPGSGLVIWNRRHILEVGYSTPGPLEFEIVGDLGGRHSVILRNLAWDVLAFQGFVLRDLDR